MIELRPGRAFDVKGVGRRIGAKIALAGGGDEPGHAVAFRTRRENAMGSLGRHAFFQERLQPVGLAIQQANFHHVVMKEVVREAANVQLEQFNPLLDAHLGELVGRRAANSRPAWCKASSFCCC